MVGGLWALASAGPGVHLSLPLLSHVALGTAFLYGPLWEVFLESPISGSWLMGGPPLSVPLVIEWAMRSIVANGL